MRELNDLIGTTAVIATLISVLFAVAAIFIANRRKKHHLAMQHHGAVAAAPAPQSAKHEPALQFSAQPSAPAPAPAPAEVAESMMYATRPTSSPLFKRLGRVGVEQVTSSSNAAPVTNDEQKTAWE